MAIKCVYISSVHLFEVELFCFLCVAQLFDADLTGHFLSGSDKCLGELLFSALQTVEDCEIKVVDCSEDLLGARQLQSPMKRMWSPMKMLVCIAVCPSVCVIQSVNQNMFVL